MGMSRYGVVSKNVYVQALFFIRLVQISVVGISIRMLHLSSHLKMEAKLAGNRLTILAYPYTSHPSVSTGSQTVLLKVLNCRAVSEFSKPLL